MCASFAQHGHCAKGGSCPADHDMVRVLREADPMVNAPALMAATFDAAADGRSDESAVAADAAEDAGDDNCMGQLHSAGYDALCTGMIAGYFALAEGEGKQGIARSKFASDRAHPKAAGALSDDSATAAAERARVATLLRRWKDSLGQQLYLTGKDFPLRIVSTQWGS